MLVCSGLSFDGFRHKNMCLRNPASQTLEDEDAQREAVWGLVYGHVHFFRSVQIQREGATMVQQTQTRRTIKVRLDQERFE